MSSPCGDGVEEWLAGQRVVLWPGVSWDLTDPKDLAQASEWLSSIVGQLCSAQSGGADGCRTRTRDADVPPVRAANSKTPLELCPECLRPDQTLTEYGVCFRCRVAGVSFNRRGLRQS